MFESLTDRFEGILTRLRGRGRLTEADVDEVLREIRTALLEADVEIGVVRGFTDAVRSRCVGLELVQGPEPRPAGHQDRQRGARRDPRRRDPQITYAGRPPTVVLLAGPAGLGEDDHVGQAGPLVQDSRAATRCWSVPTSNARPPSNSYGCSAGRPGSACSASRPIRWRWPPPGSRRPAGSGETS